jgi:GH25 family lysozyme M1 (1,4-beta-N-acetylmuramidase)
MAIRGIDISKHNGTIDFQKVKNSGIEFAMIRAGFGNSTVDTYFHRNVKGAKANGIKCGVYWFSYAYTPQMAKKEAQKCIETIKGYNLEYPVAFDFEYASVNYAKDNGVHITKALASQIADTFLMTVKNAGYNVILYTNIDYYQNYFNDTVKNKYDIWLAAYRDTKPNFNQKIWQYSEKGSVDGIKGRVDMNISYYQTAKTKPTQGEKSVDITLPLLKIDAKGNSVKAIQQLLNARGFSCGTADGIFGNKTETAVTQYQKSKNITADGIVGKETYHKLLT